MIMMAKKGVARQMTNSVPSTPSRHRIQERKDCGMASSTVNMSFREMIIAMVTYYKPTWRFRTNTNNLRIFFFQWNGWRCRPWIDKGACNKCSRTNLCEVRGMFLYFLTDRMKNIMNKYVDKPDLCKAIDHSSSWSCIKKQHGNSHNVVEEP